ncbi:MAG: carbohydrate binding domain-containing protein, partial [Halanaerobacter sp.]
PSRSGAAAQSNVRSRALHAAASRAPGSGGRDYSSQIEYKLELQEGDLVLKRNDKVVLSHLKQDIITSDGPQIDRMLSRNNKRIDINLSLEDRYRDNNLGYEIKDRVYLQDTDGQGSIIYYKTSFPDETYIHYQLDGGEWETDPPGIKMTSSQYAGYKKIYIPLENNTLEMVFNDGHGDGDDNDGNNYSFSF